MCAKMNLRSVRRYWRERLQRGKWFILYVTLFGGMGRRRSWQDEGFMGRGHLQSSCEPDIYYAGWKLAVDLSHITVVHCRLDSAPVLLVCMYYTSPRAIIYRRFKYYTRYILIIMYDFRMNIFLLFP